MDKIQQQVGVIGHLANCIDNQQHTNSSASTAHCKLQVPFNILRGDYYLWAIHLSYYIIYLFTAIGFLPGGSGYFTCKQNMKLVTTRFKSGGQHEKHVVATWNLGNHLSICL